MDDLCSTPIFSGFGAGGSDDGSSIESSSPCLSVEPAAGSGDNDQEGHAEHRYDMSSLMAQLPPIRQALIMNHMFPLQDQIVEKKG